MNLEAFNALPDAEAREILQGCCVSHRWVGGMMAGRPYATAADLRDAAIRVWESLGKPDWLEAFEGHPKIGDVASLKARYASTEHLAAAEQAGMAAADDEIIERLATGNARYEKRFGFIFIVCATGKSAAEMCALLEERLASDRSQELRVAAGEQLKILLIRLEKLL